ncbi:hypothetical protein [Aeromicrobium sp. IC_218]|uniref:hypothetical protein n=1 Tax=Aeromicrobium sp. IC_218 TaxID=2545468 RepID=UPI0010408C41|nr:hypothetical protein [Aeromicrobium sp. IC_218]TCI98801.1 hypothetical protein E0W78_08590 [Aeromicrobium sp. IC_218]
MTGSWEERAAAGEALAPGAGVPDTDARLIELLLDPENTAVTFRTAVALLDQRTTAAFRLLVLASADADDNQRDWIGDAVDGFVGRMQGEGEAFIRRALHVLEKDNDGCAHAAAEWRAWFHWS